MSAPTLRPVPRPALPRDAPPTTGRLRAGLGAAVWALLAGLVCVGLPVLLVWATDARSSAGAVEALRAAGQVWLVAHAVPLALPSGRLSVVPLGLVLLPLGLLLRAGSAAARAHRVTDLRGASRLTAAVAAPYALVAAVVAACTASSAARPSVAGALVGSACVALLGAGAGVVRTCGLDGALVAAVPADLRRVAAPAGAAVALLLGAGAVLAAVRLALTAGRAADVAEAVAPGAVGGVALLLLGAVLVPNLVVWSASWWTGTGFAVGTGTGVSPFSVAVGPVPSLPPLAALPGTGLPLGAALLALVVPLAAGVLAGVLVLRRGGERPVPDAALAGAGAGVALGLLGWLSGGAAGGARLADVGPSPWRLALVLAVEVAVPAVLVVLVRTRTARPA